MSAIRKADYILSDFLVSLTNICVKFVSARGQKSIDSAAEVSVAECVVDSCYVWEVFVLNIALVREASL